MMRSQPSPGGTLHPDAEALFSHLSERWALHILLALHGAELRFTDLRQVIPEVSAKVLTARLRELETAGFVERARLPPPAAAQVYTLGALATDLIPALDHLARWRERLAARDRAVHTPAS